MFFFMSYLKKYFFISGHTQLNNAPETILWLSKRIFPVLGNAD